MKRKHILVLWDLTPAQKQLLEGCAPSAQFFYVPEAEVSENDVANANVILGNLPLPFLKVASNLEWLQLNSAGANGYCDPGILRPEKMCIRDRCHLQKTAVPQPSSEQLQCF